MSGTTTSASGISDLPIPLERDVFLRNLLRHPTGTLQSVVGLEEATGFISPCDGLVSMSVTLNSVLPVEETAAGPA